jgi:hypothetical protein
MDSQERSRIAAQTFDLIQVQLTNSFTSTFTDADQNPFHTIWYYISYIIADVATFVSNSVHMGAVGS